MSSKSSSTLRNALLQQPWRCRACAKSSQAANAIRPICSTSSRHEESQTTRSDRPRWSYTPEQMKAPFSVRQRDPRKAYEANDNPAKLDAMYRKVLGPGGNQVLSEEVKWLAVTHKSFDQGRRGFNDRLALYGKRLLHLQATLAILRDPGGRVVTQPDSYGRTPVSHPELENLRNLGAVSVSEVLSKERLGQLAVSYGIDGVTRWKPRLPANLASSGCDGVYSASLYAILGAISLQKGGERANQVIKDAVLTPLGMTWE